ncbi:MAG: methyl-accepting chemotaxis protein, partial [Rugosibacter sp.]|nr:methyl-accepting chemotaxis protein [Rugosibacter sp.]
LVEEASTAADSLQEQAASLSEVVSVFKLNHGQAKGQASHSAAQPPASMRQRAGAVQPPKALANTKQAIAAPSRRQLPASTATTPDGDWETF